ncbi:MAG: DUF1294 domain-containing protein [Planctomycetota bacterium]|nr:DUF1294 domain-containing protein [Planctomycetota bacterium]
MAILALMFASLTAVMSLITYVSFAIDKRRAINGSWRTRESTLQLMELLGGWPGAVLAMMVIRHKTKDAKYRMIHHLIIGLHVVIWFFMINGLR